MAQAGQREHHGPLDTVMVQGDLTLSHDGKAQAFVCIGKEKRRCWGHTREAGSLVLTALDLHLQWEGQPTNAAGTEETGVKRPASEWTSFNT